MLWLAPLVPLAATRNEDLCEVERKREYDGRAVLAGNFEQRRQVAQLHGLGTLGQDAGGLEQFRRRLVLAFRAIAKQAEAERVRR